MGYPYGPQGNDPYGQPQPGYADPYAQQGYGAPAYGAQPYPAPGYEYGYGATGYAQPRVSGATGIIAAVFALLVSLFAMIGIAAGAIIALSSSSIDDESRNIAIGVSAIGAVPALLWFLGSILLFRRKTAGRVILIIMSTLVLVVMGAGVAVGIAAGGDGSEDPAAAILGAVVLGAIPLLILLCAAAPATGRWIRAARQPAYDPYPYPY